MNSVFYFLGFCCVCFFYSCHSSNPDTNPGTSEYPASIVSKIKGLIAFWDFETIKDGTFISQGTNHTFPIFLKQIGDTTSYSIDQWPYQDSSSILLFDESGPLGHAIRFNRGFIYGAIARKAFEQTELNIHGQQAFTLVSWIKFIGNRHLITGIWDEGGWHKYAGRRQVALFAGLFGQPGVIGHISRTGAASFPQSDTSGSQYARIRAIDGAGFANDEWVCVAMSYDPEKQEVRAYLNGHLTENYLIDPVEFQVYRDAARRRSNPFHFTGPIFGPKTFVMKFNGYLSNPFGVAEHRVLLNLVKNHVVYERDQLANIHAPNYRVRIDLMDSSGTKLSKPLIVAQVGQKIHFSSKTPVDEGDIVMACLEEQQEDTWSIVGTCIEKVIQEGAPFTFGRALGLKSEEIEHGSQLYIDGVAVYDRPLTDQEIATLSFELE